MRHPMNFSSDGVAASHLKKCPLIFSTTPSLRHPTVLSSFTVPPDCHLLSARQTRRDVTQVDPVRQFNCLVPSALRNCSRPIHTHNLSSKLQNSHEPREQARKPRQDSACQADSDNLDICYAAKQFCALLMCPTYLGDNFAGTIWDFKRVRVVPSGTCPRDTPIHINRYF
jgi:hypothetical protein